jgi:hypothetical protein
LAATRKTLNLSTVDFANRQMTRERQLEGFSDAVINVNASGNDQFGRRYASPQSFNYRVSAGNKFASTFGTFAFLTRCSRTSLFRARRLLSLGSSVVRAVFCLRRRPFPSKATFVLSTSATGWALFSGAPRASVNFQPSRLPLFRVCDRPTWSLRRIFKRNSEGSQSVANCIRCCKIFSLSRSLTLS